MAEVAAIVIVWPEKPSVRIEPDFNTVPTSSVEPELIVEAAVVALVSSILIE